MVVTSFRPHAAIFVTGSGSEAVSMKSSMWSHSKRVGCVLAAVLGMMAAVDPGVATAEERQTAQSRHGAGGHDRPRRIWLTQ